MSKTFPDQHPLLRHFDYWTCPSGNTRGGVMLVGVV